MKIYFHTLGCAKNLVESENLAGHIFFKNKNIKFTTQPYEADFVVVHTCSFIAPAIKESVDTILRLKNEVSGQSFLSPPPRKSPTKIIVSGCLAQVYKFRPDMLPFSARKVIDECADFVVGTGELDKLPEITSGVAATEFFSTRNKKDWIVPTAGGFHSSRMRLISKGQPWAYLRVAEGCFHRCNYCSIPFIRGNYVSRPPADILEEARRLADNGAKEINLISQDTASYGRGLSDKSTGIIQILEELEKIRGIKWIRLLYSHPSSITDELIEYIASSDKTLKYLDIPTQHISDKMLQLMGRRITKEKTIRLLERLRARLKGLVLRTTFIVGHPGETREDFKELLDFAKEGHFLWAGVFAYSKIKGTVSGESRNLPSVAAVLARERRDLLLNVLEASARDFFRKNFIGRAASSLIISRAKNGFRARPWFCAPEVDAEIDILLPDRGGFSVGDIVKIKITGYPRGMGAM